MFKFSSLPDVINFFSVTLPGSLSGTRPLANGHPAQCPRRKVGHFLTFWADCHCLKRDLAALKKPPSMLYGTSGLWWKKAYKVPFFMLIECLISWFLFLTLWLVVIKSFELPMCYYSGSSFSIISMSILNSFDFLSPESYMFYGWKKRKRKKRIKNVNHESQD